MKKTKLEKGITLVALIITIVVLLILAVVSIGAVRNSGIIGHATNTSDAWKQAQENEAGYLEGYEKKLLESTGTKVTYTDEGVPVPLGFEVVEGTKKTGLVIKNSTEGSEFVWIPVDSGGLPSVSGSEPAVVTKTYNSNTGEYDTDGADMDSKYLTEAGITEGITEGVRNENSDFFLAQLTTECEAMKESVAKYRGFYVGRYEVTENDDGNAQSISGVNYAYTEYSWYKLYKLCKTYKTNTVTGSMIWGSQWDAMMNFIGDKKSRQEGRNTIRITGYKESDKLNNIYDLIGCKSEWTMEKAGDVGYRVRRGSFYDSNSGTPDMRGSRISSWGKK